MKITLTQPHNQDGKPTPMCIFDPDRGLHGHDFRAMGERNGEADGYVQKWPIVLCARCGVLWGVSS